jgi:murein DD-endopeptidase MepM/ murein hydrolase activator NlpD
MKKIYYSFKGLWHLLKKKRKYDTFYLFLSSIVIFLCLTGYFVNNFLTSNYKSENEVLRKKVEDILTLYKNLNTELDSLTSRNNSLRVAAHLQPISKDEMLVGVGGGSFDNSIDFLSDQSNFKLKEAVAFVDEVSRKMAFEKQQFEKISNQLENNQKLSFSLPAIKPCKGDLSDGFGIRMHPILHRLRMHQGIDIVANSGSPVYATGNGTVDFTGYNGGYGLTVMIDHGFGYKTIYAHLSKIKVKKHAKILRGDIIALSGNTGLSTGPHLHYEVEHDGVKLDPEHFFFKGFNYFAALAKK